MSLAAHAIVNKLGIRCYAQLVSLTVLPIPESINICDLFGCPLMRKHFDGPGRHVRAKKYWKFVQYNDIIVSNEPPKLRCSSFFPLLLFFVSYCRLFACGRQTRIVMFVICLNCKWTRYRECIDRYRKKITCNLLMGQLFRRFQKKLKCPVTYAIDTIGVHNASINHRQFHCYQYFCILGLHELTAFFRGKINADIFKGISMFSDDL